MNRDMSYALDGAFSTRNQGQLVSTQRIQTQTMRTPGLVQVRDSNAGGMGTPSPGGASMPRKAGGMSGLPGMGAFDITLPIIGTISWPSLLFGAAIGIVAWKLSTGKRQQMKSKLASALVSA
jgi:hypothetical protein